MAKFYSNENFPLPVVEALRMLGHDVLTTQDAGKAGQAIPDEEVLAFAIAEERAVLTINRKHFIRLHGEQPAHAGVVVSFSPDGKLLATGSYDNTARLWHTDTGKELYVLSGHPRWVNSVSFSPDGELLATGSEDGAIRLWRVGTGKLLRVLNGDNGAILSVSFRPDGKMLASGSQNKVAQIWPVYQDLDAMIAYTKTLLLRQRLTCEERDAYFLDKVARCESMDNGTNKGNNQ